MKYLDRWKHRLVPVHPDKMITVHASRASAYCIQANLTFIRPECHLSKVIFLTLVVQPFCRSPCPQKLAHILRFQEHFVVKQCFVHLLIRVHSQLAYFLLTIVIHSKLRILINRNQCVWKSQSAYRAPMMFY